MANFNSKRGLTDEEIQLFLENISDDDSNDSDESEYIPTSIRNDSSFESFDESGEEMEICQPNTPPPPPLVACRQLPEFEWAKEVELPIPFNFTGNPGIKINIIDNTSILEFVKLFLSENFVTLIVEQTNIYAQQLIEILRLSNRLKKRSRMANWVDTTVNELYVYFALVFMMGVIKKPDLTMYWSQNFFLNTPFFSSTLSRDRFMLIRKCLHFSNNIYQQSNDKLYKIRPVIEHFINTFQETYTPNSNICVDEILEKWKGRLSWRQFIPSKRARFGMKLYLLCEVGTFYTYNMIVYTGKGTELTLKTQIPEINQLQLSQPTNIILCLAEKLFNQGYTLTCDNWYGSPELCYYLNMLKTDTYGTAKANRAKMPQNLKKQEPAKHEPIFYQSEKMTVMRWRDPYKKKKKIVTMISTIHDDSELPIGASTRTGEEKIKPVVILDYNATMGAVDAVSQMTDPYKCARKGHKWFRKLFEYLMDIAMLNSYILFKISNPTTKITHKVFIIKSVEKLIEAHNFGLKVRRRPSIESEGRLTARHFPKNIPATFHKKKTIQKMQGLFCTGEKKWIKIHV